LCTHLACFLPLYAVTGVGASRKRRGKETAKEEEVVRPSKLTDRQREAQKVKKVSGRGRKGTSARETIDKMPYSEYRDLRKQNPYEIDRNPRVHDLNFHSKTQEDIYT
jgi:hypothetical protein